MDALVRAYEEAESLAEAEGALDALAAAGAPVDLRLGDLYDELATAAAEAEDHARAASAQAKAIEHGCAYRELGREMLGWYLLLDDRRAEADELFDTLRSERGQDPELEVLVGNALMDAGEWQDALTSFDRALEMAGQGGDRQVLGRIRIERRACRLELALPMDEDDRLAPRPRMADDVLLTLAWFPRDEREEALHRWPDLAADLRDPEARADRGGRDHLFRGYKKCCGAL